MRNCLVLQPFGLGDCIFAQGIPKMLGYENVLWPVLPQYRDQLVSAYPSVDWCNENFDDMPRRFIPLDAITIPIRWSDTIMKVPYEQVMRAKYDMYNLDYHNWSEDAMWQRYSDKEQELFNSIGVDKYNLISTNFSGKFLSKQILVDNGLRNIYLNPIQDYSLFDWAMVMERATEIHFVSSSSLYMLECLDLKAEKICIYQRSTAESHNRYNYLFSKHKYNWL